ncbi:hypothetical protein BG015_000878, partial [Linnemannia schmuckeri]
LPIVKTTTGDVVTLAKATEGLEISTGYLPEKEKTIRIMSGFFRRLGVVMFDAHQHRNHSYLRRLQIDYTNRRVLELIVKRWPMHASSFVISDEEAEFLRSMIISQHGNCKDSVLYSLGDLPIWKTYGSPNSPLLSAKEASFMTNHERLDHLGHHPTIVRDIRGVSSFDKLGASPIQASTILGDYIMPKFKTKELHCVGQTRDAYLGLCRSLMITASLPHSEGNAAAKQVLKYACCFLARDGSFQTLAHMFVPQEEEELTEKIFVNEQHRFIDSELPGVLEECATFVLDEIANGDATEDQILSRATRLVRYIYTNPGSTNWMDPKWKFVPRELHPEYPYNQNTPALPRYMSFSTLCNPMDRDYLWTQRGFFPQDLVPPAVFHERNPNIGTHTLHECCQHLDVLVRNIAPNLVTTEQQLVFKLMIFKIYESFEVRASENQTVSDNIKKSLREVMTVPYILNGDDKDPTKAESWVRPQDLVFGIDHKIGTYKQPHESLLKFRNFLVTVGAYEMEHITGQVEISSNRKVGELEDRITMYFETQDDKNGFMDVKFVFKDGKSILAHKVVLASMSEEVIRQLTGSWSLTARRDPSNPAIDIIQKVDEEDDYDTFWGLLHFLYTDNLIDTNGPILSSASNSPKDQEAEDYLSQRINYLMALQALANYCRADRLKNLIAQELMLPDMVMYSNVFDIRAHAELNQDADVVKYCNQFMKGKKNASLIEKYLEDEIDLVQVKMVALAQYLEGEGSEADAKHGGSSGESIRLNEKLEDLRSRLKEVKLRR